MSIEAFFDAEAAHYDNAFEDPGPEGHALRSRHAVALEMLGDGPGELLDAGMGPGRLLADLHRRGWDAHGVDASAAMVAAARARLPDAGDRLAQASIERLPFEDERFDVVAATGVLEYVDDVPAAVAELARVLRPGGRALISMPNPVAPYVLWRQAIFYPAVRVVKAALRMPRPARPKRRAPLGRRRVERVLRDAGLKPEAFAFANMQVALTPIDELLPRPSARLAAFLERRARRLGPLLATQLLFLARKRT